MDNYSLIILCLALAILLLAQSIALLILVRRRKRSNPTLTKKQLYREIERHQETELSLKETQTYLQALIDSMPSILIGVSRSGTITHWNASAAKITGLTIADVFGNNVLDVFPELPVSMTMIKETISSGEPQHYKNLQQGDGLNARYTDLVLYPLLISEAVEEAVVMATDVSQRVHIENRLIQNDKMQSLGEMAAGLAHEINNPLAGILNHVQNVIRRTAPGLSANEESAKQLGLKMEDIQRYLRQRNILSFLDNIKIAGERASSIVQNMLNFSRNNPFSFVETDIEELIEHASELAINSLNIASESHTQLPTLEKTFAENLPTIECSPVEIQQVIINLLRNAVQSFDNDDWTQSKTPRITIAVHNNDKCLSIVVDDNGPGIAAEERAHIFEPFFTTKAVGKGTGLGLSVCYFIVSEHHNGKIEVESKLDRGTRFIVTLPLKQHAHKPHSDTPEAKPIPLPDGQK